MSTARSLSGGELGNSSGSGGGLVSIQTATVTIPNGTALSNSIDCRNLGLLIAVLFPAAWTAAKLGFQASIDNITFYNVVDSSIADVVTRSTSSAGGWWMSLTNSATTANVAVGPIGAPYLKLRSGVDVTPVNQAADRILTLTFQK